MKGEKVTKEVILFVLYCKEAIESTMVTKITFMIFYGFCKKSLKQYLRTTQNNVLLKLSLKSGTS